MYSLPKILVVDDDQGLSQTLSQALQTLYDVETANTGKLGLYKADSEKYEIIILDLNLPDISGFIVCQQLRERGLSAPILILSGESRVLTKINLLDAGASDYLTKPFSLGELKARLRVLLRKPSQTSKPPANIKVGDLILDRNNYEAYRQGQPLNLRRKEFGLLEILMENAGKNVSRQALQRRVWGSANDVWTNTVDVHIKYLRDKVDRPFGVSYIKTAHGIGYKLEFISNTEKQKA
jgi:two-component system OmpR family response regulator